MPRGAVVGGGGCVSVVVGGSGGAVVVAGAVVTGTAVVVGADRVERRVVVAPVVVAVLVVPYAPLNWYWPCHVVHCGDVSARGNGTSGRLPIAVSMKRCQICAGNPGPETAVPCTFSIGVSASG